MLNDVWRNYRVAMNSWLPFLVAHVFIRLATASLLVPIIGALLASTLYFSDQSALTDQDIAWFFLTPVGAIGAIAIASMVVIAIVLDVVIATAIIRQGPTGPLAALQLAAGFALHSVQRLAPFMARLVIRILVISVPFLAIAGAIAFQLLTEFDINYYLTEKPPEFLIAAGMIGAVLAVLGAVLLITLSGWAIAMHLALFDRVPASQAFKDSKSAMQKNRLRLAGRLVCWMAIRGIAAAIFGALTALLITWVTGWRPGNMELLVAAILVSGALYAAGNFLINSVSNGALADLLNDEFERALFGRQPAEDMAQSMSGFGIFKRSGLIISAVVILSALSLGTGGLLLEQVKTDASPAIIAHRGAAAMAPENTMAAVQRAITDGADWVEIDVQENADGDVIVVHDSDFMKSSGNPMKVWDATGTALADLDIGSWFGPDYANERVPLLQDVLKAAQGRTKVLIELKYYGHDVDLENRVISIVEDTGMVGQIATMSLKYPAVQKMRSLRPDWDSGVLAATSVGDLTGLEGDFLALNQARITARTVRNANDAGKTVYAWTVNDPLGIARMLWIGVDGLITDDPALARTVLEEYNDLSIGERFLLTISDSVSDVMTFDQVEELRP